MNKRPPNPFDFSERDTGQPRGRKRHSEGDGIPVWAILAGGAVFAVLAVGAVVLLVRGLASPESGQPGAPATELDWRGQQLADTAKEINAKGKEFADASEEAVRLAKGARTEEGKREARIALRRADRLAGECQSLMMQAKIWKSGLTVKGMEGIDQAEEDLATTRKQIAEIRAALE